MQPQSVSSNAADFFKTSSALIQRAQKRGIKDSAVLRFRSREVSQSKHTKPSPLVAHGKQSIRVLLDDARMLGAIKRKVRTICKGTQSKASDFPSKSMQQLHDRISREVGANVAKALKDRGMFKGALTLGRYKKILETAQSVIKQPKKSVDHHVKQSVVSTGAAQAKIPLEAAKVKQGVGRWKEGVSPQDKAFRGSWMKSRRISGSHRGPISRGQLAVGIGGARKKIPLEAAKVKQDVEALLAEGLKLTHQDLQQIRFIGGKIVLPDAWGFRIKNLKHNLSQMGKDERMIMKCQLSYPTFTPDENLNHQGSIQRYIASDDLRDCLLELLRGK